MSDASGKITISVAGGTVSGLLLVPPNARAGYVFAHGAGAGMAHPFMAAMATLLAEHGIATLRYQFPYMEGARGRPDSPAIAEATVAAAVTEAGRLLKNLPLHAGGKSFGGRMTSQAASHGLLPAVRSLVFVGFPLHPPGKPSDARAVHLGDVTIPMLFLQGTRDEFADLALLEPLAARLGERAELHLVPDADHSFHVPARSGRKDADVRGELAEAMAAWMDRHAGR